MSTFCEQELMLKNFWFGHKKPIVFVTPQFGPHVLYPAWLTIQLFYHIFVLAIDGYQTSKHDGEPSFRYFLYLTNWAYLLLVLSNLVDLSVTLYVHCLARYILEERESEKAGAEVIMRNRTVKISYKTMGKYYKMRGYLMVSWIFFTVSSVTGITVSTLYWTMHIINSRIVNGTQSDNTTMDYNLNGSLIGEESNNTAMDYSLNGWLIGEETLDFGTLAFTLLNTVVILIHLAISAKPFRLLHFYLPVIFFIIYMIFSVIYQAVLHHDFVYKILDWNQVFRTTGIAYGVVFIVVPLEHLVVFGLVQLRISFGTWFRIKYSFSKWKRTRIKPLEPEVDRDTNVMRWMTSNRGNKSDKAQTGSVTEASTSRVTSARAETTSLKSDVSIKSETSL